MGESNCLSGQRQPMVLLSHSIAETDFFMSELANNGSVQCDRFPLQIVTPRPSLEGIQSLQDGSPSVHLILAERPLSYLARPQR